jgi:hypothetical protein
VLKHESLQLRIKRDSVLSFLREETEVNSSVKAEVNTKIKEETR